MSSPPEEDIRRTLARYCMLGDDGRLDEWSNLFAEGARFHVAGRTYSGRDEIRGYMEQAMPDDHRGLHLVAHPLIDLDSWNGTAFVWSDYVFVDPSGKVGDRGRFHDVMERGPDKTWRFTIREVVARGDAPAITKPVPAHTEA